MAAQYILSGHGVPGVARVMGEHGIFENSFYGRVKNTGRGPSSSRSDRTYPFQRLHIIVV